MVKYVKSGQDLNNKYTPEDVVRLANYQSILCVSATVCDFERFPADEKIRLIESGISPSEYSKDATQRLKDELAQSNYNYIETVGGWVDPTTKAETIETSFIVLGPNYDEDYQHRKDLFKNWAVSLCNRYHQWAVLIIDDAEDVDGISELQMDIRKELYAKFHNDTDYMTEDFKQQMDYTNAWDEYYAVKQDLESKKLINGGIYHLHGVYYDKYGGVVKEFNNMSSKAIGNFFTQLARHQGADRFTMLATINLNLPYMVTNLRDKYAEHTLTDIYAQQDCPQYINSVNDALLYLFEGYGRG